MPDLDHAQDLPSHEVTRRLAVAVDALIDVSNVVDELARRHGVESAARLLGLSPMSVSRWRHGDVPGLSRIDAAQRHAHAVTSPEDPRA